MAKRKQRTELLVGLFVLFGLLVMGFLILQFGKITERIRDNYSLLIEVPDATGIRAGVPVRLGGAEVGFVGEAPRLKSDFSGLLIDLRIFQEMQIPLGSSFSVGKSGLMGDSFINVTLPENHTGEFYRPGSAIRGKSSINIDDLPQKAHLFIGEVSTAVDEIGRGVDLLEEAFDRVDEAVLDEENLSDIKIILAQLKRSSQNMGDASGELEPLLKEAGLFFKDGRKAIEGMDETLKEANVTLGSFQTALDTAAPTVAKLDPTLTELQATLDNLNRTIQKIENGNGLASALLNDSELRRDLESFADKLEKNGVLGYPKNGKGNSGGGIFNRSRSSSKPTPPSPPAADKNKKRNPFSWLKQKN